ncbi:MAG: 50S ribosomal protein L1 [bacterium]
MKRSKRYRETIKNIEAKKYTLREAIEKVKQIAKAKYDESVDIALKLNIDPKKTDQLIRGISNLPHGTGKKKKVLVLTKGDKEKEAQDAGADYVGFDEYIDKIKGGWADVDVIIATPDVMSDVGKLGKILGPRGLMPSPKVGTVTFEVADQVQALKKGKVEFKTDKTGCLHIAVGRISFDADKLRENVITFLEDLLAAKSTSVKGQFIKSMTISSTIGPGITLDAKSVLDEVRKGGL